MSDENIKTFVISPTDDYSRLYNDSLSEKKNNDRGPKGFVELYELDENINLKNLEINKILNEDNKIGTYNITEPIVKKNNLISYPGREWLASSVFGIDNPSITPLSTDKIYWAGLGSGGATESAPFDPINPDHSDTELNEAVMINETDDQYGDFREDPDEGYYKKLISSVSYEEDDLNDDYYLISKVTITVTSSEANGNIINEAGLFIASQNTPGYSGNFTLFSHVTFPSIAKTSDKQLVFIWYIYG